MEGVATGKNITESQRGMSVEFQTRTYHKYHSMEAATPSRGKKENDCGTLMFKSSSVFRDR